MSFKWFLALGISALTFILQKRRFRGALVDGASAFRSQFLLFQLPAVLKVGWRYQFSQLLKVLKVFKGL